MIERSHYGAIITAAGESSRMGCPKALMPFNGLPLVDHQIACLRGFGQIVVVTGCDGDEVVSHVGRSLCAHNENFALGRSHSIEVGARMLRDDLKGAVVVGVDQPLVTEILVEMLMRFDPACDRIAVPVMNGKKGHPLLFSSTLFPHLRRCSSFDAGLRGILKQSADLIHEIRVYDERIFADLNEPEDIAAAEPFWP